MPTVSTATRDRTGILIFVSLAERYARIIADDGIAAQVPQSHWQSAVDELTARMSRREIAEGFPRRDRCLRQRAGAALPAR